MASRYLAPFLVALAAPLGADVIVVDQAHPASPTIQEAIDAGASGDIVLVEAGDYEPFVLDKPMRVLGVGSSLVRVGHRGECHAEIDKVAGELEPDCPSAVDDPGVVVTGIAEGGFAMVAGMDVRGTATQPGDGALRVLANDGVVVLHDITVAEEHFVSYVEGFFYDYATAWPIHLRASLSVEDSALVAVSSSRLHGQRAQSAGGPFWFDGSISTGSSDSVVVTDSEVWFVDSLAEGGSGYTLHGGDAGRTGITLVDAVLYTASAQVEGGGGGTYSVSGVTFPLAHGDALAAQRSVVKSVGGSTLDGGGYSGQTTGFGLRLEEESLAFVGPDTAIPVPAEKIDATSSRIDLTFTSPFLIGDPPIVGIGDTWQSSVFGNPGEVAFLFFSTSMTEGVGDPSVDGLFALPLGNYHYLGLFTIEADGRAQASFPVPSNPQLSGVTALTQALVAGSEYLGVTNPMPLVVR